jgi:hypothetical protein
MNCPVCDLVIDEHKAWKGMADRFYCSEFCADSEGDSDKVVALPTTSPRERFDRQYMKRLHRLVALRKQYAA